MIFKMFLIMLLFVVIIILFLFLIVYNIDSYKPTDNYIKDYTFRIVLLNTPNYDHIGCYGANSVKKYCDFHGYKFTQYRDRFDNGLHINFSKNSMVIDAINKYKEDFIVVCDADVGVSKKYFNKGLITLFDPKSEETVLWAPRDFWIPFHQNSKINAGFCIWRNCQRSKDINEFWIEMAVKHPEKCKSLKPPRQQNTFDICVYKKMRKNELKYLDHKWVGLPHSKLIFQTKKPKISWEKIGSPDYRICNLSL